MPFTSGGCPANNKHDNTIARQQGMLARWQWRLHGLEGSLHQLGHRVAHRDHLSFIKYIKSRSRHVSCMHGSRDADVHAEFMAPCPRERPRSRPPPGLGACTSLVQLNMYTC